MINFKKDVKIHFIGIGGIGMSGIAEVLLNMGHQVSGSDLSRSSTVEKLKQMGATIWQGHSEENVKGKTVVVYSSAIDDSNPEIKMARELKLPIMRRAEMLAELMRLKHGLAVAGTHGKTTTTSFLATILQESGFDPTYIIGGIVDNLKGHAKVGSGSILVAEADESDGSFLLLNPIMSVITNVDNDHLDFYKTEEKLFESFLEFANRVPFYGLTSLNIHDPSTEKIRSEIKKPYTTFGLDNSNADFEAKNISMTPNLSSYDLYYKNKFQVKISIRLPGRHNILNSLGAISLAYNMGVSFEQISTSIGKFNGVGRRLQTIYNGEFELIDDYAHHPTEILTTLKTLRETRGKNKIIAIFEPHRFSRTRDCWNEFLHSFNMVDQVYIAPIYPASEIPIDGITSERLVKDINQVHPNLAVSLENIDQLESVVQKNGLKDTTIITLGAGSIGKVVRELKL